MGEVRLVLKDEDTCYFCEGQLDQTVVTYNFKECTVSQWKSCRSCGKGVKFKQRVADEDWNEGLWEKDESDD